MEFSTSVIRFNANSKLYHYLASFNDATHKASLDGKLFVMNRDEVAFRSGAARKEVCGSLLAHVCL